MAKELFTDEQVEQEITRLLNSEEVQLAKREIRIKNKRRQYMYSLRSMARRGKELIQLGYTMENIEQRMFGDEIEND